MASVPFRKNPRRAPSGWLGTIAVSGQSMNPTYNDGDWLLFRRFSGQGDTSIQKLLGRVLVIERESYPGIYYIKRCTQIIDQRLWVEGDNSAASTDSREWGSIAPAEIKGVVLFRYKRASVKPN